MSWGYSNNRTWLPGGKIADSDGKSAETITCEVGRVNSGHGQGERMTAYGKLFAIAAWAMIINGCGGGGSSVPPTAPAPPTSPPPLSTGPATCAAGSAGDFSCAGISLRNRVSLETMGGTAGNDIWGWFDV